MSDDDRAARVWRGLQSLVLDRYARRREVSEALGMSFVRAKALRRLAAGPMTMRDLTAALTTDPPYTTVIVGDLERRGLVTREAHPTDRRSKLVTATPAGLEAAARAERILGEPPAPVRELPAEDLAQLERILDRLAESPRLRTPITTADER